MTTKLAVVNLGAHGHVNPTLPVVAELVRRGIQVSYFATPEFEPAVKAAGARFFPYESLFTAPSNNHSKEAADSLSEMMAKFPLRLMREAEHALPQILAVLDKDRPDAIWYDNMAFAGRFAAQVLNVPALVTRPTYVANQHFNLMPKLSPEEISHPARLEFRTVAADVQKRWNLPAAMTIPEIFMAAEPLNVVFIPRAFQPAGDTFDDRYAFVGPAIAPRPNAEPFTPPADGKPLILISLGTVFNDWPEFFSTCFEAFGSKPVNVVMAIGNRVDPAKLGAVPANFRVEKHVPQLEILPHTSVFVTHGGQNSTQEALYFGVPLVVIPQMIEQAATARRVAELKLGKSFLTRPEVTAGSLGQAVEEIQRDPSYRANVATMQKEVKGAGGYLRAADLILRYLTT